MVRVVKPPYRFVNAARGGRGRSGRAIVYPYPFENPAVMALGGRGRSGVVVVEGDATPPPSGLSTAGLTRNVIASMGVSKNPDNTLIGWQDQGLTRSLVSSSSAPVFVQNAINGQPAIRFGSTTNSLADSANLTLGDFIAADTFTAFAVIRPIDISTNDSTPYLNEGIFQDVSPTWGLFLRSTPEVLAYSRDAQTSLQAVAAPLPPIGSPCLITWWHEAGQLFVQVGTSAIASIAAGNAVFLDDPLYVGSFGGNPYGWTGDLGAFRVHNVLLPASDRMAIQDSLIATFGL